MLASIVTQRLSIDASLLGICSMRYPRSTPTNTLLWFSHVTKRTTCPTLLFQSVKGSDPFRRGTSYSLAAPRYDALCQHLANQAVPHQNGAEPALTAHALIKKSSPQSAQDEARSPGLAEKRN